jgi:hypothetical protein
MEAVGFWPRGNEPCGRRRSGSGRPTREFYSSCTYLTRFCFAFRNASDPFFAFSSLHRHAYRRRVIGQIRIRGLLCGRCALGNYRP